VHTAAGKKHYTGEFWSATVGAHLSYESRLELDRLWLADFDGSVGWIATQPFWFHGKDGADVRRHVPDGLPQLVSGDFVVVDVSRWSFNLAPSSPACSNSTAPRWSAPSTSGSRTSPPSTTGIFGRRGWGSFVDSAHRFCPVCLQEDSYWKGSWREPLSVACPRHRILYVDRCPGCGEQPWHTNAWLGQCVAVTICTARVPATAGPKRKVGQWCGADLREAPRIPAADTVVQAQAFLTGHEHWVNERSTPTLLRRFGIDIGESREVLATLVGAAWTRTRRELDTAARRAAALHMGIAAY
jgi:TniQ